MEIEGDRELYLLTHIVQTLFEERLISVYKQNKIEGFMKETLSQVKGLGDVCMHMVNTLNPVTYRITLKHCQTLFEKSKTLVYKYRLV